MDTSFEIAHSYKSKRIKRCVDRMGYHDNVAIVHAFETLIQYNIAVPSITGRSTTVLTNLSTVVYMTGMLDCSVNNRLKTVTESTITHEVSDLLLVNDNGISLSIIYVVNQTYVPDMLASDKENFIAVDNIMLAFLIDIERRYNLRSISAATHVYNHFCTMTKNYIDSQHVNRPQFHGRCQKAIRKDEMPDRSVMNLSDNDDSNFQEEAELQDEVGSFEGQEEEDISRELHFLGHEKISENQQELNDMLFAPLAEPTIDEFDRAVKEITKN